VLRSVGSFLRHPATNDRSSAVKAGHSSPVGRRPVGSSGGSSSTM